MIRMASFLPAASLLLLLLSSALGQLLSEEERTLCTLETQRLYHCASYTSPKSLLTPKQQQICCDAVRSLHEDGCFCGWGEAAEMSPWTRDVLLDLASAHQACTGSAVSCRCGEEYLDGSGAAAPFATPELQALQTASQAVSSMAAQQGWSSSSISGRSSGGGKAAAPALPSGRSMGRLLPWAGGSPERSGAGRAFDLEVEVQREGGDAAEMTAAVQQLMEWMLRLISAATNTAQGGRGDAQPGLDAAADRMDRIDAVGSALERVVQAIGAIVNGTDAQVELALEITVEASSSSKLRALPGSRPALPAPGNPGQASPRSLDELSAATGAPDIDAASEQGRGCLMQRAAAVFRAQPARFLAIAAALAFLCLLGTFAAQVVATCVSEARRLSAQRQAGVQSEVLNPLLAPELAVPLIDVQSALHEGYCAQYQVSHSSAHMPPRAA